MNTMPKVTWGFRISISGSGPTMEDAYERAILDNAMMPVNADECDPLIEQFDCPCGRHCVAVQSWQKVDLSNEFARDYVCPVDGRRWTVDFEGDVYEHDLWVILQERENGEWTNDLLQDLGSAETQHFPATYRTVADAVDEVKLQSDTDMIMWGRGEQITIRPRSSFKIISLREYLKLDEKEDEEDE